MTSRPLRVTRLLVVALVVGVLSALAWHLLDRQGTLVPRPTWFQGVLLLALAASILAIAYPVRTYLAGRAGKSLDPERGVRTLVLAQAAALTGAAVTGWYAGQLAIVLRGLDLAANKGRLVPVGLLALAGLVLAAAGLVAQSWCKVEPPGDDDAPGSPNDAA